MNRQILNLVCEPATCQRNCWHQRVPRQLDMWTNSIYDIRDMEFLILSDYRARTARQEYLKFRYKYLNLGPAVLLALQLNLDYCPPTVYCTVIYLRYLQVAKLLL